MREKRIHHLKGEYFTPIMPDGFIGRPWDNVYTLKDISFENKLYFLFSNDISLTCDKSSDFFFIFNSVFIIINDNATLCFNSNSILNKREKNIIKG